MKGFKNYSRATALKRLVKFRLRYRAEKVDPRDLSAYLGYLADMGLLEYAVNEKKEVIGLMEVWRLKNFEGCDTNPPKFDHNQFDLDGRCLVVANLTIHPDYKEIGMARTFRNVLKAKYSKGIELAGWRDEKSGKLKIFKVGELK